MMDVDEMKTDDAIDSTLAILGNVAAPDGMESRLRQALRQQVESSARQRWTLPFSPKLLTSCLCGLVLFAAVVVRQSCRIQPHTAAISSKTDNLPAPNAVASSDSWVQTRTHSRITKPVTPKPAAPEATGPELDHPAPPLPLTDQEKLLLRIAHRGDPVEMAALDDAQTRLIDFEAQKSQFNDFFYIHPTETPQ